MADAQINVEGDDSFIYGMNSFVQPSRLQPGQYASAMNIINRGGVASTRPGSKSLSFDYIEDGESAGLPFGEIPGVNLQGITTFIPAQGTPALVFVVDGIVYQSKYPFKTYSRIPGLQFGKYTPFVAWAQCVQSTTYDDVGNLVVLDNPKSVLIIQDGATRAAYWDGSFGAHINPTQSGSQFTLPDRDGTPVGLWMKWSNNRLWLSVGNKILASDAGNPLKFTETQYPNEGRAFYLPGNCTGIIEVADQSGIICFTKEQGTLIKSAIHDRTKWTSTAEFTKTILPFVGCVAPRSLVNQYGTAWWYSSRGLVNMDDAQKLFVSSKINVQDQEMSQSKLNVDKDVSKVAGGFYENFLFHAVPYGDKYNTRLHVLDQAPGDDAPINSWPSYWEGWRPVEFTNGIINNHERSFCLSADYDGKNRIWELFLPERTDNGIPITCYVETKQHFFENRDRKKFKYAEIEFNGIDDDLSVMIAAAGTRGGYQNVGTKEVSSKVGQIYYDVQYGLNANDLFGYSPQSRVIRSRDGFSPSDCNSACVESNQAGLIDKAFSLLIVWSGAANLNCYRVFSQGDAEAYQGRCEDSEDGETRLLTIDGCGSREIISNSRSFDRFYATATMSRIDPDSGDPVSYTATQSSIISQVDANRKASAIAKWKVLTQIGEVV